MSLDSMDRMHLLNEVCRLKAKLNLGSELVRNISPFLIAEELTQDRENELKDYVSDLGDFLITR